ncbi:MAG: putative repeat protein (TIGR04138 family) [Verrucomicrobiales bacterium]|jgi:uncharacterized repeat protein (TIGR04138 family)
MQKFSFEDAVEKIVVQDPRYSAASYYFLREALDYTIAKSSAARKEDKGGGHVDGGQLLDGFRRLALKRFGPMATTVFDEWGIRCTGNVGAMVFNLIEAEVFGKTENDTMQDFEDVFDFHDAFNVPFLPKRRNSSKATND